MPNLSIVFVLIAALATGCAGYNLTPLANDSHDTSKEGYVFYAPQPFLLGTLQAGKGDATRAQYEFKPLYLPDRTRPYRFTRYECFAKSDLKINFAEGWQFTGAESKTDTTAALSGIIELAKLATLDNKPDGSPAPPQFLLFRVTQNSTTGAYELEQVDVQPKSQADFKR